MTADGPDCDPGFYCVGGATNRRPVDDSQHQGNRCLAGKYCELGTGDDSGSNPAKDCPAGTYSSALGIREVAECITCPNSFMCENPAMVESDFTNTANQCDAGYYCGAGIDGTTVTK